jgi:GDP-L-fucose synthase
MSEALRPPMLRRDDRIYVAGHTGLAGSAIVRRLRAGGYESIITRRHAELDLLDQVAVAKFFRAERPDAVFLAAARVGGIMANATRPAEFLYQNLMMECNAIHAAHEAGVRRLLFLGSSCIYPRLAPQPMPEECLLTGPLESTNEAYAVAKIAGIKLCNAYRRQYGRDFLSVMPTNLYGPGDNYDPASSHVLPALIRRMLDAVRDGQDHVVVWGSGRPRREFLYSEDMADACVFVMERMAAAETGETLNVGCGEDVSIAELAALVAEATGFRGRIVFDTDKPDGTPRKLLDVSRLTSAGWRPRTALADGIRLAVQDFIATRGSRAGAAPAGAAHTVELT